MKKEKTNKLKKVFLGSLGVLFAAALAITPITIKNTVVADTPTFLGASSEMQVSVYGRNGKQTLDDYIVNVDGENVTYQSILWKDITYFEIDCSGIAIDTGRESYDFQYNITWAPTKIINNELNIDTDWTVKGATVCRGRATTSSSITKKIRFYISDIREVDAHYYNASQAYIGTGSSRKSLQSKQEARGAWGVYQFTFKVNDEDTYSSKLFEVKPTNIEDISAKLEVSSTPIRSKKTIDNAYSLAIKSDEYKFVDRENLVWKVTGKGSDGKSYVLLPEDKESSDTTTQTIIADNSYNRTGTTFVFDPDIAGHWEITCEAKSSDGLNDKVSKPIEVSTVKIVPSYLYIIIIGAAVVVAVVILVVIIVVTKKKEKIW